MQTSTAKKTVRPAKREYDKPASKAHLLPRQHEEQSLRDQEYIDHLERRRIPRGGDFA